MNILSNEHPIETIQEWRKEDHAYIQDLINQRKWYETKLEKYAHVPRIRAQMQEIHESLVKLIVKEKEEYTKNYGQTYQILSSGPAKAS